MRLQISTSTLSRVLAGRRPLTYDLAIRLLQSLDISDTEKLLLILLTLRSQASFDFERLFYDQHILKLGKVLLTSES